ncbi:uncharacterized protein LACBIDRAFT_324448 [Laccaria bicolor S238N-H82]|uniref:Predicted protein n=1 Tax=Laccaria bicolor (strain S238N-H82 / ATCC MYA-4686) TaxID=486041 RepID=B0D1U9_LACBS|nr:uncharacterized protein LACBIDRAFT_324448 [Laccaria bicolor S238N-H82]EDR11708.1 predicted protein [Laccaria bicolor S238N-H82]|eukprot:XP_001877605.1 predicted protein [Laccaria bicolor S238N-H82]
MKRKSGGVVDELLGLDEAELDRFILKIPQGACSKGRSTGSGDTDQELEGTFVFSDEKAITNHETRLLLPVKQPRNLCPTAILLKKNPKRPSSFTANMTIGNDDKDDKSDGEGMYMPTIIVEEEPGTVAGATPSTAGRKEGGRLRRNDMEVEDEASDDEKGDDDLGWEDVSEQEV